jgi:hypothetical protein
MYAINVAIGKKRETKAFLFLSNCDRNPWVNGSLTIWFNRTWFFIKPFVFLIQLAAGTLRLHETDAFNLNLAYG